MHTLIIVRVLLPFPFHATVMWQSSWLILPHHPVCMGTIHDSQNRKQVEEHVLLTDSSSGGGFLLDLLGNCISSFYTHKKLSLDYYHHALYIHTHLKRTFHLQSIYFKVLTLYWSINSASCLMASWSCAFRCNSSYQYMDGI